MTKKSAAQSPFAARMMEKPRPESMNPDPEYRIFVDPPEIISLAFGGRTWLWETGCNRFHRIGMFLGLGWQLDPMRTPLADHDINGVRVIVARTGPNKGTCTMKFVHAVQPDEGDHSGKIEERIIELRTGVPLDQLKARYLEVVGPQFDNEFTPATEGAAA